MAEEARVVALQTSFDGPPVILHTKPRRRSRLPAALELTPYNICCMAIKIFSLIVLLLGIMALSIWILLQPKPLEVTVNDAKLLIFNLTAGRGAEALNSTVLHYKLFLNLTLSNPNDKITALYDGVEAVASFAGIAFASMQFGEIHQRKKEIVRLRLRFKGETAMENGGALSSEFYQDSEEGFFSMLVNLHTRVRLRLFSFDSKVFRPEVECQIRLPSPENASSAGPVGSFNASRCEAQGFFH